MAWGKEQGARSMEQGAGSREQGAGSREYGVWSMEQGARQHSDNRHRGNEWEIKLNENWKLVNEGMNYKIIKDE